MKVLSSTSLNRLIAISLGLALTFNASAESDLDLDTLSQDAEYVFKGTVVDVQYRQSEGTPENPEGIPHTFVTYKVDEEYKSQGQNSEVTLRFTGGVIDEDKIMLNDSMPLMDIGDKDLLFVAGNGQKPCPLVNCKQGRFREIDGYMFDDDGSTIVLDDEGSLKKGKSVKLDDVSHHKFQEGLEITVEEAELENEAESIEQLEDIQPEKGIRPDPPLFSSIVQETVIRTSGNTSTADTGKFQSQNPDQSFVDTIFSPSMGTPPNPSIVAVEEEPEPILDELEEVGAEAQQDKPIVKQRIVLTAEKKPQTVAMADVSFNKAVEPQKAKENESRGLNDAIKSILMLLALLTTALVVFRFMRKQR